jgi:hypothetical protein
VKTRFSVINIEFHQNLMEQTQDEYLLTRDRYPQLYPPTTVLNTTHTEAEICAPGVNSGYPTRKIFYNTQ